MQGWLDPIGPEPVRTYWVRRGIVLVLLVALVATVVWLFIRSRATDNQAASTKSVTASGQHSPGGTASATPSADQAGQPTPPAVETTSPSAPAGSTSAEPGTPTPEAPTPCRSQGLSMRVEGANPVSAGHPTTFKVVVSTAQVPCVLNLADPQAVMVVTSGSDRIWASSDCPAWQLAGTLELVQAQEASFEVGWPVRRSNGCELVDTTLGSGTYVATATIGSASARHVMQLQP